MTLKRIGWIRKINEMGEKKIELVGALGDEEKGKHPRSKHHVFENYWG